MAVKNFIKKYQVNIILVMIFFSMLVLNMITPLIMDDFNYSFGIDGRINSLQDILSFQIWHYLNWGGRSVAHTLVQLFLMNTKIIFNFCNALIYTVLIYNIYKIIKNNGNDSPLYLVLIHFSLWFLTPAYGQSFLWLTGSCNYLWTATIITIFINKFLNFEQMNNAPSMVKIILFFLLGLISGWTNENSSAGLVCICMIYLLMNKFLYKQKINRIQISGFIGTVIGFIILILAPGNYIRSKAVEENVFFIFKYCKRFYNITMNAIPTLSILLTILIIVLSMLIFYKRKFNKNIVPFVAGILVSIYSMILSPVFPSRSWTITIIFMTIVCGMALNNLDLKPRLKNIILVDSVIIISLLFFQGYSATIKDTYHFYQSWNYRINTMKIESKKGTGNFKFDIIYSHTKQSPGYGLDDIYEGKNDINNKIIAKYFKVKSIEKNK